MRLLAAIRDRNVDGRNGHPRRGAPRAGNRGKGRPKPTYRLPVEILRDEEVRALLDAVAGPPLTRIRNRALIATMYRAGLRVSEALDLRPKDLDPDAGSIRVLHGKGDRARTVGVDAGALAIVGDWLEARRRLDLPPLAPLFCSMHGTRLTTAYVRRLLPDLAGKAGIAKRVHAHGLRHTHASQLREEGVDILIISRQLGHASLLTTIRYLDHVAPQAVVEAMGRRSWRSAVS